MNAAPFNAAAFNAPPAGAGASGPPDLRAAVVRYLATDAAFAALVGPRVYPGHVPQSSAWPASRYQVVSDARGAHLDGGDGTATARMQLDCYARTLADALAAAAALERLLHGFRGSMAGLDVLYALQVSQLDGYEPPQDAGDVGLFRVSADYAIRRRVPTPRPAPFL